MPKNSKEEKLEMNLYNGIKTFSTITCSKCGKHEDYFGCDGYEAVEPALRNGWYATENNVYCPKCNSKRRKNSNQ
jgi:predicted nucleic-acid-binding Zn-ribbon protein